MPLRFKATDVFQYYKPSPCARRVSLLAHGVEPEKTDDPLNELLRELGHTHEVEHLATLSGVLDLSSLKDDPEERERRTLAALRDGAAAVYQPRFRCVVDLDGDSCELVGEPDFLLRSPGGAGHVIRDSKLARRLDAPRHAGIPLQLQVYGFLYERAAGAPPAGLQIHSGTGDIVPIAYEGADAVFNLLREHRRMRGADLEAYEPVGWSKCEGCGYNDRCWSAARAARDVAILPGVDQKLARKYHARGISDLQRLDAAFADASLRDLFYDEATRKKPASLKRSARTVRRALDAHLSGRPVVLERPDLPAASDCVAFDLEGLPAYADDLQKIYLWGLKDYRADPPRCTQALAGFGDEGDLEGWTEFLGTAAALLESRPQLVFVHWGNYEPTHVGLYAKLYGDPDGVAAQVLERSLDLHRIFKDSVALPVESYGLKSIGKYLGLERQLPDYEGGLAIVRYIEAVESSDAAMRRSILGEILAYNEEDLDATRAALEWLRRQPFA